MFNNIATYGQKAWRFLKNNRGPKRKTKVLIQYFTLLSHSFWHQRISARRDLTENIFGRYIKFSNYPQLIDLFEEIFLENHYFFETKKADPVILDLGSNIGLSILFFKLNYPNSTIVGFEPDPETFTMLQNNVKDFTGIELHCLALGPENANSTLYRKPGVTGSPTMTLVKTSSTQSFDQVDVRVAKLSSFVNAPVNVIKIDTEGSEDVIIDDLIQHDKIKFVSDIIVEFHPALSGTSLADFESKLEGQSFKKELVALNKRSQDRMFRFKK